MINIRHQCFFGNKKVPLCMSDTSVEATCLKLIFTTAWKSCWNAVLVCTAIKTLYSIDMNNMKINIRNCQQFSTIIYGLCSGFPLSYIFLASRTPGLSIFGVQWRHGIEISASTATDHFIPTALQMMFSTAGLHVVTRIMTQPNCT